MVGQNFLYFYLISNIKELKKELIPHIKAQVIVPVLLVFLIRIKRFNGINSIIGFFFLLKNYFNCKYYLNRIQFYYISYIFKSFLLVYVKIIKSYINKIDVRYPIS